jgi:ferredoxin
MIISKPKPFEEILTCLEGVERVFLVGCGECATVCQTGGEDQVTEMKAALETQGKQVTGYIIGESACHILNMKRELRKHKAEVDSAQALLVMACGAGAQTFSEFMDKPVYTANDSMFLGNVVRFGQFAEHCSLCGSCIINDTGGICPVTNCAKGLLNGPCGGANHGMCELDSERECAWVKIYKRLEKLGQLDKMRILRPPKDYCTAEKPRTRIIERKESGTQGS